MANPLQFEDFKPSTKPECRHCEELLADAVDDLLSPADQVFFDRHIGTCADCMAALADARRGAAWLDMLKTPRPEPSAELLERIILATSGSANMAPHRSDSEIFELPAFAPAFPSRVLPFRPRVPQVAPRWSTLNRLLFEPRLAMTAAMAFFSIALTLNLAGVHLNQLHARDLRPAGLRRSYYEATASVTRRYEGLRVVHTVESRLDDLRETGPDADAAPELGQPESRRDVPTPQPVQPAPKESAPAVPKHNQPSGGMSLRTQPWAEPRVRSVAESRQSSGFAYSPAQLTPKEGGLA